MSSGTTQITPTGTRNHIGSGLVISESTPDESDVWVVMRRVLTRCAGFLQGSDTVTVGGLTTWTGGTMNGSGTTLAKIGRASCRERVEVLGGARAFNKSDSGSWTKQLHRYGSMVMIHNRTSVRYKID